MGERIEDPSEAVERALVQLEDLSDVDRLRACRKLRDWSVAEIERLAPGNHQRAVQKEDVVARLVVQGLPRAMAEVEVTGRMSGDRFVVRARGLLGVADQSWTRKDGVAAKGVMQSARDRGWPSVSVHYWTEDGFLVDVTCDVETAT